MSLVGFEAKNHPQQVGKRGPDAKTDDRGTEQAFFDDLNRRYRFDLDVAATEANAKCERFFDLETDGLAQSWAGARVWCNPPYSDIGAWVRKAWMEWRTCGIIVMLLPANRTEQSWWQDLVEPYRDQPGSPLGLEFLKGRLRFVQPGKESIGANERPPFGCCLLTWSAPTVEQPLPIQVAL